jgi:replication-associated recombination protein RarA
VDGKGQRRGHSEPAGIAGPDDADPAAGAATRGTLATRVTDRDRDRFVGRVAELALLESCLEDDPPANVVLVHGPGGIGKSTLLRELARRAQARGIETFLVEGRELPPMPDALKAVLSAARGSDRPLVLIDSYERMTALAGYLRRGLLPSLPERTLVVIAGRTSPDEGWFAGGWEGVATELELGAMGRTEAADLLDAQG